MDASDLSVDARAPARLYLLNTARLELQDGSTLALERHDAALLVMLAIDGALSRSAAAAQLWPEAPEARARSHLRQRLFRLGRLAGAVIHQSHGTLQLADELAVDLSRMPALLERDANALRGELLGAHSFAGQEGLDQWVQAARMRWRESMLDRLAAIAGEHETHGRIAAALPYAQRIVADDPLREHGHRRLMRLHYLRGDRAAAMAAFEHCRDVLGRELGVRPGAETLELLRLIEAARPLEAPPLARRPLAALRPPRLIGRDEPWQRMRSALLGRRCLLLTGEPGIGKSRLLGDFCAASAGSASTGARPGDAALPHALLARLLRTLGQSHGRPETDWVRAELARIAPEFGPAAPGEMQALRLQQAIAQALLQWRGAGLELLAIDDLHFADAASVELLPALVAAAHDAGLAWALACRSGEMPGALTRWRDDLDGIELEPLALGPLDHAALQALLASLDLPELDAAAWAGPLHRHTGGNPMFLLETLIAMLDRNPQSLGAAPRDLPSPGKVGSLIERRLGQLGPAALKLARLAALAGQDFSVELAADVLGGHALELADPWRELEAALVIRDNAFAHDLIYEATLRSVPEAIARTLHGELARSLRARGGEPARIAEHWQQAGHWSEAGAAYLEACASAGRLSQRRHEADLAARATNCFERAGDQAGEFTAREIRLRAASYVETFAVQAELADALVQRATTPQQLSAALEARAAVWTVDQRDAPALADARAAGELARSLGDADRELAAARLEARALSRMNRHADALEIVRRYSEAAEQRRDAVGPQALIDFGAVLIICERGVEASALLERALIAARCLEDWGLCHDILYNLGWSRAAEGDLVASTLAYEQSLALRPRIGADRCSASLHVTALARQYKELGRFGEALALFEQTLQQQRSERVNIATITECELANCWLWLGQTARAAGVLRPPAANAAPAILAAHEVARARVAFQLGHDAMPLLREAARLAEPEGRVHYRLAIEREMVRSLPAPEAAALGLDALARCEAQSVGSMLWPLRMTTCDALRRAGRSHDAARLARDLMAEIEHRPPAGVYAPDYCWIAHQALDGVGDTSAADAALQRAVQWIKHTALPNVPDEFRDSFLHRNPVNRAVLTTSGRRG